MTDGGFDFAVVGGSAEACLLAGLLAAEHGKRVCLIGAPPSPYRLARRFDLSVGPLTRPESWALLKRSTAETLKLLNSLGKGLFTRIDPIFIGETPAAIDLLGHMRYVAAGMGYAAERVHERSLVSSGSACRIRDAAMLVRERLEPALETWLGKHGVRRASTATIDLRRDGSTSIRAGDMSFAAERIILADDTAILDHLPATERQRLGLASAPAISVLTEPTKGISAPYLHYLDRGVTLAQRPKSGLFAIADGQPDEATLRIGASIGAAGPLRRVGQAVFRTLSTPDGAPVIGAARLGNAVVIAGLGPVAAFLAPALARHLTGASGAANDESAWFIARDAGKASQRAVVAENPGAALPEAVN